MAYIDTRLPISVEKGASGGPTFNTTVHSLASGYERRSNNWAHPLSKWDISYGLRAKQVTDPTYGVKGLSDIVSFFYTMRGKANSFRFRDWLDYFVIENEIEQIGDNSRTEFQLTKRYSTTLLDGVTEHNAYHRKITKPTAVGITYSDPNNPQEVSNSLPKIEWVLPGGSWGRIDNRPDILSNISVPSADDYFAKTGIIKFLNAPPNNTRIRWSGFFENHVRFDTDSLSVAIGHYQSSKVPANVENRLVAEITGEIPDIPIIELRS